LNHQLQQRFEDTTGVPGGMRQSDYEGHVKWSDVVKLWKQMLQSGPKKHAPFRVVYVRVALHYLCTGLLVKPISKQESDRTNNQKLCMQVQGSRVFDIVAN
jgi:hypothetical protein